MTFYPNRIYGYGSTETVNTAAGNSSFVSTTTSYMIDMDPDHYAATLTISKASFAEGMPPVGDMELCSASEQPSAVSAISLRLSHDGYSFNAPVIIPTIAGVPYPRYAITGLNGVAKAVENRLDLGFNCMKVFHVEAVATALDVVDPYRN